MMTALWLLLLAIAVAIGLLIRHNLRKWDERKAAEEERFANFMKGTAGVPAPTAAATPISAAPAAAPSPAAGNDLALQKLLFDAAHKSGEAGEPALSIQLYARLLARYPASTLAEPARAAVEAQKKKLPKA